MSDKLDDLNIAEEVSLLSPEELLAEFPLNEKVRNFILFERESARSIIHGKSDEVLVIVGPCSIHDIEEAKQYAEALKELIKKHEGSLRIIMRSYMEKPRSTIGWKGLINDPHLDGSHEIEEGLRLARGLLVWMAKNNIPASTEFLDMVGPQYIADTISWGAIGARTVEAQNHRELTSGLSMPIGMKNTTAGDIGHALDAMQAASHPHNFLSVGKSGRVAQFITRGNQDTHLILRGGGGNTNYDSASVKEASARATARGLNPRIMIDASHANSLKDYNKQPGVIEDMARQIHDGSPVIIGTMIESNIKAGNQKIGPRDSLLPGVSITDACVDLGTTRDMLDILADAVKGRRSKK